MELTSVRVDPFTASLEPTLKFTVELGYLMGIESLVSLEGFLLSEDKKILAGLKEIPEKRMIEIKATTGERPETGRITISMITFLSRRVLDYIEDIRGKNPKKDINFTVKLNAKYLFSNTRVSNLELVESSQLEDRRDARLVIHEYRLKFATSTNDMWILSGDGSPTFLQLQDLEFERSLRIPANDWIHEYAPCLGIGRYMVVELPVLESVEIGEEGAARINEAINSLAKMDKDLKEGEWNQVIEDSRPVLELLRNDALIKEILMREGHTEEAADSLLGGIRELFNYSSKFHHKIDKSGKKIMQDIRANKEDAYLIYTTAVNLVNLLARKFKRLA